MPWFRKPPQVPPSTPAASPPGQERRAPAWEDYGCPDCGAVLRDTGLRTCPYCRAALFAGTPSSWKRIWRTRDGGLTWTVIERRCPQCGAMANDPAISTCAMCGASIPKLTVEPDLRPTMQIRIVMPSSPVEPGKLVTPIQSLVRYLDNDWWPVPPSVPAPVAGVLRLLPDLCPHCAGTIFRVVVHDDEWTVICAQCHRSPGRRPSTPANS